MDKTELRDEYMDDFEEFRNMLEDGDLRAAEKNDDGEWEAIPEVKEGILLAFQMGDNVPVDGSFMQFKDKDTLPPQEELGARTVPGGSSVRSGAYVSDDVIVMPPAYINVGGYVDDGTMVDSHALVGSAAQIGEDVHLSTGAKTGGVLEPINQAPVVVEDDAMVGANSGVYEGTVVRENAVIAPNVELSGSTEIVDLASAVDELDGIESVDELAESGMESLPLDAIPSYRGEVPENAVVVGGSVPYELAEGVTAEHYGGDSVHKDVGLILKYRDESTDANTALEDALR